MLKRNATCRRQSGFTLIELAIGMAIFALLIAIAAPGLQGWFGNTRIRGAAESIQNGIQTARAEAIKRNRPMTLWLVDNDDPAKFLSSCTVSDTGSSWIISVNAPGGNCDDAPSDTVSPMIVTGRTVGDTGGHVVVAAIDSSGNPAHHITFNGFGTVTNTDAISQIDIQSDADDPSTTRSLRIIISANGMVRMCDPNLTKTGDPRLCPASAP